MTIYMDVGLCYKCRKWQLYGHGPCACGTAMEYHREVERELDRDFFQLLMAVQEYRDKEPLISKYHDPRWFIGLGTNANIREAVGIMTGVAARYGVLPEMRELEPAVGTEITLTFPDGNWLCFEDAKTHMISKIRKVEAPPVEEVVTVSRQRARG